MKKLLFLLFAKFPKAVIRTYEFGSGQITGWQDIAVHMWRCLWDSSTTPWKLVLVSCTFIGIWAMEDTLAQDPSIIGGFTIGNVPLLGPWLQDSVTKGIFDIGLFLAALISGNVILVVGKSESQYLTRIETIVFWNFICLVVAVLILASAAISEISG